MCGSNPKLEIGVGVVQSERPGVGFALFAVSFRRASVPILLEQKTWVVADVHAMWDLLAYNAHETKPRFWRLQHGLEELGGWEGAGDGGFSNSISSPLGCNLKRFNEQI